MRTLWLAALLVTALHAYAQPAYPTRPVRIITPNAPGGSSDVLARLLGQKLTEGWGQQVVIDNRPGGNGFIGGDTLARAAADGYTLMVATPTHIITPLLVPPWPARQRHRTYRHLTNKATKGLSQGEFALPRIPSEIIELIPQAGQREAFAV